MQAWEGFRRKSGCGLCRFDALWEWFRRRSGRGLCGFDACIRRNQMQEWLRFVQVKCLHEKDSDAGVGEVCAGLMLAWEGFRGRSGWGLCRFDASMRRIQTQEWVSFLQVWCLHEKDSNARVREFLAGLMLVWEGFRRKREWGLCRFDARMRRIQTLEWACRFGACMRSIQTQVCMSFMQVWCLYEKDSYAGVGEVCAGLMTKW